jgi:outer membrane biosynthesis protein TonB
VLTLGVLFVAGVGAAAAGNGKPETPPGQGECEHGNSGKPCRDDPQPDHGRDCEQHGNQGGVNEDHCGGTTAPEPPATTVTPPPPPTTTTVTTPSAPVSQPAPVTSVPAPTPPKHEPKEERASTSTPPRETPGRNEDAPKQPTAKAAAEPKQGEPKQKAEAAVPPAEVKSEAVEGCAPTRVLAAAPKTAGSLPFTGLPLWAYVLGGLAALLAGLGLRRLARARSLRA